MKNFIAAVLCILSSFAFGQDNKDSTGSCHLRISLLTCSPGTELYSTFGHSALRVVDSNTGADLIFNYGTFDFEDPSFYSKFTRGKLLYFLSVEKFDDFLEQYKYEQRGVIEQVLHLSCEKKEALMAALRENAKEENRYYKYDFTIDNCTTRLRDIVLSKSNGSILTSPVHPGINRKLGVSFRDLIHEYLDKGEQHWSKLGIDILLGSPLDRYMTNSEAMFLPDYLLKGFDNTTVDGQKLVENKQVILESSTIAPEKPFFTPFVCFSVLFLIVAIVSFTKASKLLYFFDVAFFFLCGLLGLLLVFMWFGTDHQTARDNFNLLWAFPLHVVIVFFLQSKRRWPAFYFLFTSVILLLLLLTWKWLPQEMNNGLLPIVALLLLRSFMRYKSLRHGKGK